MRVGARIEITAPIEKVWSIVSDPTCALSFMSGITRWEVASEEPMGLGARYRMLLRVGSAEVGGLIEIVEWDEPCELAWNSIRRGPARAVAVATGAGRPNPGGDPPGLRRGRIGLGRLGRRASRCSHSFQS